MLLGFAVKKLCVNMFVKSTLGFHIVGNAHSYDTYKAAAVQVFSTYDMLQQRKFSQWMLIWLDLGENKVDRKTGRTLFIVYF